jgi:hypothetical protein
VHSAKENELAPMQPKVIEITSDQLSVFLQNPKAFIEKIGLGNSDTNTQVKPTVSMNHKTPASTVSAEDQGINDIIRQAKVLGYNITVEKIVPELSLFEQYKAKNVKLQSNGIVATTTELSKEENLALIKDAYDRGVGFSVVDINKVPKDLLALVA